MVMKKVSLQTLKATLSAAVVEAESGHTIVITRHNQPVAKLIPAFPQSVHRGRHVGRGGIKPAIRRRAKIPYLDALLRDRADR